MAGVEFAFRPVDDERHAGTPEVAGLLHDRLRALAGHWAGTAFHEATHPHRPDPATALR